MRVAIVARLPGDLAAAWRDELEATPARLLEEAVHELRERSATAMERVARAHDRVPAAGLYGEDLDPGPEPEGDVRA